MPLTHKAKVHIARRIRTQEEVGQGVGLFQSLGWRKRKWQIMQRVHRHEVRAKYYSELRRGER